MMNATWPLAIFSGDDDTLYLSCFGRDYVFAKRNIERLSRYRSVFSTGLRIEHNLPWYPSFVVFWVSPFRGRTHFFALKKELESFGYAVHE